MELTSTSVDSGSAPDSVTETTSGSVRLAAGVELRRLHHGVLVRAPGGRAHVHVPSDLVALLEGGSAPDVTQIERADPDATETLAALEEAGALEGRPAKRLPRLVVTRDGLEADCGHRLVAAVDRQAGRFIFSRLGKVAVGVLAAAGLVACLLAITASSPAPAVGPFAAVAVLIGLQLVGTLVHELGHALVVVHHGRRLGRVGLGLYWGQPCAYVDATDALFLPRRVRMAQATAGVVAELAVAVPLALLALAFPGSPLAAAFPPFAALILLSVLFNAAPLLELDGYWLLADTLDRPDLNQFARRALVDTVRGVAADRRLAAYAALGVLFGALLLVAAAVVWWGLLGSVVGGLWDSGPVGRALAIAMMAPMVTALVGPAVRLIPSARTRDV